MDGNLGNNYECRVIAEVQELDRGRANRTLAKAVKIILTEHDIPIA
jgi:hypothetical protein